MSPRGNGVDQRRGPNPPATALFPDTATSGAGAHQARAPLPSGINPSPAIGPPVSLLASPPPRFGIRGNHTETGVTVSGLFWATRQVRTEEPIEARESASPAGEIDPR